MFLAFEIVVDTFSQGTGSLAVDDADRLEMSKISIVQIFVEFCDSLIYSFAEKIDLSGNAGRFGHTNLACSCTGEGRGGDHRFVD